VVAEEEEGTPPRVDHRLALRRSREVVGVSEEGDAEEERGGGGGGGGGCIGGGRSGGGDVKGVGGGEPILSRWLQHFFEERDEWYLDRT